jgi:hypothetical protein
MNAPESPAPPLTPEAGRELLAALDWRLSDYRLVDHGWGRELVGPDRGPGAPKRVTVRLEVAAGRTPPGLWDSAAAVRRDVAAPLAAARAAFLAGPEWAKVRRLEADLAAQEEGLSVAEAMAPVYARAVKSDLAEGHDPTVHEGLLAKERRAAERFGARVPVLKGLVAEARRAAGEALRRALQEARSCLHREAAEALDRAGGAVARAVGAVAGEYLHAAARYEAATVDAHSELQHLSRLPD